MSIKEEFLSLLEKDKEFRYAVAGLLGLEEILRRLDRHEDRLVKLWEEAVKLREEQVRLREDMLLGFKRHDEILKRHEEEIAKLREDMNRGFMLVERHISALGARWGLMSEEAFREGIRQLVEKEFGFKVEKWVRFDEKGLVFGYPSQVDVDVAIHDQKIILIEVKSHVRASDVAVFKRKAELYSEVEGKKPSRLLIVTPYVEEKALEAAKHFNIEIYTKV